jgi:hypothetical protein
MSSRLPGMPLKTFKLLLGKLAASVIREVG